MRVCVCVCVREREGRDDRTTQNLTRLLLLSRFTSVLYYLSLPVLVLVLVSTTCVAVTVLALLLSSSLFVTSPLSSAFPFPHHRCRW